MTKKLEVARVPLRLVHVFCFSEKVLFAWLENSRDWYKVFDTLTLRHGRLILLNWSQSTQLWWLRIDTNDIIDRLLQLNIKNLVLFYVAIKVEMRRHVLVDNFIRVTWPDTRTPKPIFDTTTTMRSRYRDLFLLFNKTIIWNILIHVS